MAASATFALKVAVWFRRGRLFMVSPDSLGTACPLSGRNSCARLRHGPMRLAPRLHAQAPRLVACFRAELVGLIGRGAVYARVGTSAIIKVQVTADRSAGLGYTFV